MDNTSPIPSIIAFAIIVAIVIGGSWLNSLLKRKQQPQIPSDQTSRVSDDGSEHLRMLEDHLADAIKAGDVTREARARHRLGEAFIRHGQPNDAIPHLEKAAMLAKDQRLNDYKFIVARLADAHMQLGRWASAAEELRQAIEASKSLFNRSGNAGYWSLLGDVYVKQGKNIQALEAYETVLRRWRGRRYRKWRMALVQKMSTTYLELNQIDVAISVLKDGARDAKVSRDRSKEIMFLGTLGVAYERGGLQDEAMRSYEDAIHLADMAGDRRLQAVYLFNLGLLLEAKGQNEDATTYLKQAWPILINLKSPLVQECDQALSRLRKNVPL